MGVLTAAGIAGVEQPDVEARTTDLPDEAPPANEPENYVSEARVQRQAGSRRRQVEDRVDERLKAFEELQAKREQDLFGKVNQLAEQNARLTGMLEAFQRQPPPAAPAAPKPPEESPEELLEKAGKLLEEGKWQEYERTRLKASEVVADRRVREVEERMQRKLDEQRSQQISPALQQLIFEHKAVAKAGPRGLSLVQIKDQELGVAWNLPPGPERVTKAFELAEATLANEGKSKQSTGYSSDSAAALAAVPTNRPTAGKSAAGEGYTLTAQQLAAAKAAGMTKEEYVRWLHPEKYVKPRW